MQPCDASDTANCHPFWPLMAVELNPALYASPVNLLARLINDDGHPGGELNGQGSGWFLGRLSPEVEKKSGQIMYS